MQPMYNATWPSSWCWWLCAGLVVSGCGRQSGLVGKQHRGDAGTSATVFQSELVGNDGQWSTETNLDRASIDFGIADPTARDGRVATLVFPGDKTLGSTDGAGPDYVTQLATLTRFHFGTLRTRVSFGNCASTEEVVHAILGYFSDGTDHNGNGITDDVEIDFQIACSAPQYAYLSVYTDYQSTPRGEQYRKLSHIVDFATGSQYDTPSESSDAFAPSGANPNLARPGLLTANTFYELGFEWHSDSIRFFIVDGSEELTLWTLEGSSRVPQLPVYLTYNLWHPTSHWYPTQGDADFPASDVVMKLDWVEYVSSGS